MQSDPPAPTTQDVLESENFIDTYRIIAEWIRFADTKAAATLTVNGVMLGLLVPTLKTYTAVTNAHLASWWTPLVVVLFLGWLTSLVLSATFAFLCILPLRGMSRQMALSQTTHFHPAAVAQKFPLSDLQRFVDESIRLGTVGLKREVLATMLIDSHLSNAKYRNVTRSIWCLAGSVIFAFFYLLAIQF